MSTTTPITSDLFASSGSLGSRSDDDSPASSLAFIRLDEMSLLEDYRPSREEDLVQKISGDGYLSNPLIASQQHDRVFALDGHHRRECLRRIGCSHALIQHVPLWDQQRLVFDMWSHVSQVEVPDELIAELKSEGLIVKEVEIDEAVSRVSFGAVICCLTVYDCPACRVYTVDAGSLRWVDALTIITNLYQPTRLTSRDLPPTAFLDPQQVFETYRRMNLFVRFAPIARERIAELAFANERMPCGITRTILPAGRILGVNVPLDLLRPNASDAERDRWLAQLQRQTPVVHLPPTTINEAPSPRRYDDLLHVYGS